jgi:sigma-B regulation protein RsbU (phosphoserine phosphatase)
MSQKGISFRLNSHVTAFAILIISVVVYINYHFSNKILIGKIEEGAINQSNLVISKVARITVGAEEIARNVSYQALYYYKNDDLDFFLHQVLASNKILESIHVELFNDIQAKFTACQSTGQCQHRCNSENNIFPDNSEAMNHGIWSEPFYCMNDTLHLLVAYRMPIYFPDSKKIAGMVFCEISLRKMKQMLSELKIGSQGYAFIIEKSGNYITHPKDDWILNKNFFKKPTFIFQDKLEKIELKIRNGEKGAGYGISEYLGNQPSWFYFAPLVNSDWTIIIVIPEKELFKEIGIIFQKIIWVSGFGILLLFILNMLIFKRILTPLAQITHSIQRFSSLPGKEQESKDEIKMLADSLKDWQEKYGYLINERNKTASERLKYEKDLNSAREIQLNIIPTGKPDFSGHPEIDLYAILKPAETVGGDLYDYFFIDENHLLVAIGDVSGKGIPASLFMAVASTLIKTNAKILSAKDLVTQVNSELSDRNANQYFLTLFVGILDVRSGVMDYCNAAHNYPYILHANGTITSLSKSHGLPLGIYKDKLYKSSSAQLRYGDLILLYTDGVINSTDSHNHHYGSDKLEKNIQNLSDMSSEEVVNRLVKSIVIYEGGSRQSDDITLVALRYLQQET